MDYCDSGEGIKSEPIVKNEVCAEDNFDEMEENVENLESPNYFEESKNNIENEDWLYKSLMLLIKKLATYDMHKKCKMWKTLLYSTPITYFENIFKKFNVTETVYAVKKSYFLRLRMCHWKGWMRINEDINDGLLKELCIDLYFYTRNIVFRWIRNQKKTESDNKNDCLEIEDVLSVTCSLKILKSLFYSSSFYHEIYSTKPRDIKRRVRDSFFIPEGISNWPFVSVELSLPDLVLQRTNYNHNDFRVVNLGFEHKPIIDRPMDTNLHYKPNLSDDTSAMKSSILIKYLQQFINLVENTKVISSDKKLDLLIFSKNFKEDLELADGDIEVKTEYYANLCRYPYVRYFANTRRKIYQNFDIVKPKQPREINIRLQQITYPAVKFQINCFNGIYCEDECNNEDFNLESVEFHIQYVSNYFKYICTLCNMFVRDSASMRKHIMNKHGHEPDWVCYKCEKTFQSIYLSSNRWSHDGCDD